MKFLVGYDQSETSKAALRVAVKHATVFKAGLHVVQSLTQSHELNYEGIQRVENQLDALKKSLEAEKIECEMHAKVSANSPGESLVEFAGEYEIDEIFVGVRRRSRVGKLLLGSNAQYVILNAPCPVVAVK